MARARPFLDMASAPLDGTTVEIRHGGRQDVALAYWNGRFQGWIRDDDPMLRVLQRATGWRLVIQVASTAPNRARARRGG